MKLIEVKPHLSEKVKDKIIEELQNEKYKVVSSSSEINTVDYPCYPYTAPYSSNVSAELLLDSGIVLEIKINGR